jgi:predicted RNA methylase
MKRIVKSDLDKFYTKVDLVKSLIQNIDFDKYELVVDPCCGDGSFYSNVPLDNKIGIDISPDIDGVINHDFLTWDHTTLDTDRSKIIVISNPPFGKQGSLAMKFIKKSSEFSDTIAFILPLSFVKDSVKNRIPEYYHLKYEEILPEDSFLMDGSNYSVKCVFQIWERGYEKRSKIGSEKEIGFRYIKKKEESDISIRRVGFYAGKCWKDTNKSDQSHYFISLDDKSKIDQLILDLNSFSWNKDLTVGPRSISKGELNVVINSFLGFR